MGYSNGLEINQNFSESSYPSRLRVMKLVPWVEGILSTREATTVSTKPIVQSMIRESTCIKARRTFCICVGAMTTNPSFQSKQYCDMICTASI